LSSSSRPWFVFVVHPRDVDDLRRWGVGQALATFSAGDEELVAKACTIPPIVVGEVRFGFAPYRGELLGAVCMPEELLTPKGQGVILRAVEVAATRASVVGLGGLTGSATGGGLRLVRHLPSGATLTNGSGYTAAVVRANVVEAARAIDGCQGCRVAVVGCTGAIGVAASALIAEAGLDLILIGRTAERARSALAALAPAAVFSGDISDVRHADIVVLLTNEPSTRLTPARLRPGAVVIDVAQPLNIPLASRALFQRRGVIVVDGGIARITDYRCTYDGALPERDAMFACLAETYLFAREGIREHSVGRPTPEHARRMERIAPKYGVTPRPLDLDTAGAPPPRERLLAAV
jgi:fatty aldehyde-generating acyl-ACP reductase